MQIWAKESVLSLFPSEDEAYFFDQSGRFFAAWSGGWFVFHGRSGRSVARRWNAGEREVRTLMPSEVIALRDLSKQNLGKARKETKSEDLNRWIVRALSHDAAQDHEAFKSVYRPVGILPPDQYGACVVQLTEGCAWNQCQFCSFYRHEKFHVKEKHEIRSHVQSVAAYFGAGLSMHRSIFLGEANALAAPLDHVLYSMSVSREELVPHMRAFRGFYAFNEVADSACRTSGDFRALGLAGLRRLYYGLETGDAELRNSLGKPGTLEEIEASVFRAKEAGILLSLILLIGPGGLQQAASHVEKSVAYLRKLPLDLNDIVFLSPLHGKDGTNQPVISAIETRQQIAEIRRGLSSHVRVAPYDIREFVY